MLGLNSTSGPSPARQNQPCCQAKQRQATNCYQITLRCSHLSNSSEKINFLKPRDPKYFTQNFHRIQQNEKTQNSTKGISQFFTSCMPVSFLLTHLHLRLFFALKKLLNKQNKNKNKTEISRNGDVKVMILKIFIQVQVRAMEKHQ